MGIGRINDVQNMAAGIPRPATSQGTRADPSLRAVSAPESVIGLQGTRSRMLFQRNYVLLFARIHKLGETGWFAVPGVL